MSYVVVFRLDFYAGLALYQAVLKETMPFAPFVGLCIGPSQLFTVERVHWLGGINFHALLTRPPYFETVGFGLKEACHILHDMTGMTWEVNKVNQDV